MRWSLTPWLLIVANGLLLCATRSTLADTPSASAGLAKSAGYSQSEGAAPLDAWRKGVKVSAVLGALPAHSIHAYFNTSPESPDGKHLLFFRSTAPDAQRGEVCLQQRGSGETRVLAKEVETEDAHRVACQQWTRNGQAVVYHTLRHGLECLPGRGEIERVYVRRDRWLIASVELSSGEERQLAVGRQLCWGTPTGEIVPIYGPHWQPGEHRDLELLNTRTGEITKPLTLDQARADNRDWFSQTFGEKPTSIFFPILSPDASRVLFKIATPAGGGFRHPRGSQREGLFCYDLASGKMLCRSLSWGHPAWHSDSKQVINVRRRQLVVMDSATGVERPIEGAPLVPGSHPAFSPDGQLYVTDWRDDSPEVPAGTWRVIVGDLRTGEHVVLHEFLGNEGATSWRVSHPHPVFSADGKRVYFNVNAGPWTRLFVAAAGG